jgi:integrase
VASGSGQRLWFEPLRETLRSQHGRGWSISAQSGKTKLTRRYPDGSRSSVMLDVDWSPSGASAITAAVAALSSLMHDRNISLKEAQKLLATSGAVSVTGSLDWPKVVERYMATRSDRRKETRAGTERKMQCLLATLETRPKPRDGRSLMYAYAQQHFGSCPAGGEGRVRHFEEVRRFLNFAVDRVGVDSRWRPIEGAELREPALIGTSDIGVSRESNPAIKPEQLIGLLNHLEASGKHELRLAVALVGLYGLRPAELAALRPRDGKLYVGGQVKRNIQNMRKPKKDRRVISLDLLGMEGEGARVLALYESGKVNLPKSVLYAIQTGELKLVGHAFRQLLIRDHYWQLLKAANPKLCPYSLRHGWAYRAYKYYDPPMLMQEAAKLMGHTVTVHQNHYSDWVEEEAIERSHANMTIKTAAPTR